MTVITLSRQVGSRGDEIAVAVAERLGLRLIGRELINRAAREAGAPEVALAEIDELGLFGIRLTARAIRSYREKVAQVIEDLATAGDVLLLGRGAQVVLAGRAGVLRVRVIAPDETRIRYVAQNCRIGPDVAAARMAASDRARIAFLRRYYGAQPNDLQLYDMVLNTAHLALETAIELICAAAQRMNQEENRPV